MSKSLLKTLDSILKKDTESKSQSEFSKPGERKWLKEATLSRVTERILNELSTLTSKKGFSIVPDMLEDSGLNEKEKELLSKWVSGKVSGKYCLCMLAAVEEDQKDKLLELSPDNLVQLLATMVSFPSSLLEKKYYRVLENIFSKSPLIILGEILNSIAKISKEKSLKSLRVEQINLAFKQIRLEKMKDLSKLNNDNETSCNDENLVNSTTHQTSSSERTHPRMQKVESMMDQNELKRLRIMMELVKLFFSKKFQQSQTNDHDLTPEEIPVHKIVKELEMPMEKLIEESQHMSHLDLDLYNAPIKSYITHLSLMKNTLSNQLKV